MRAAVVYIAHRHTGIEVIGMRHEEVWREQLSYMLHTDTQASNSYVWDTRRCDASSCLCLPHVCLIRVSCIHRCGESSCSRHWMR